MNIISLPGLNVSLATTPQGQNNVNFGEVEETNFGFHLGSNTSFVTAQYQNNVNFGEVEETNFGSHLGSNTSFVTTQCQNNVNFGEVEETNFGSHLGSNTSFVTTQCQNNVNFGEVEETNFGSHLGSNNSFVTTQYQSNVNFGEDEETNFGSHLGSNASFVTTQYQNNVNSGGEEEEDYMNFGSHLGSNASFSQVQDQNNVDFVSTPVHNTHFRTQLYNQVHNLVADGSVGQFLNQPELFTERGSSTFCANDYKKKQHKEVVRQLTSNHGCVKRGLWENISSALSQHGHKNFSPPQCANKWKNIKQDYKKNSEYQYKSEVDSILGNNWHKSDIF
ncbi:unnamed protein product [Rhizophagus irregularis]|nr:unnamed protein product [Rhizophagus irregularis]